MRSALITTIRVAIAAAALLTVSLCFAQVDSLTDGQARESGDSFLAWDSAASEWVEPDVFWQRYADRRGGLTWGRRTEYPPYNEVNELDTLIIELESGPCLMEFFHTRWRRANDVRRWDDAFNAYAGCPNVFD